MEYQIMSQMGIQNSPDTSIEKNMYSANKKKARHM